MTNPYEDAQRARKVAALAVVLLEAAPGIDGEIAAALDDDAWRAAARLAEVRPPSEKTRAEVVALLDQLRRLRPGS